MFVSLAKYCIYCTVDTDGLYRKHIFKLISKDKTNCLVRKLNVSAISNKEIKISNWLNMEEYVTSNCICVLWFKL